MRRGKESAGRDEGLATRGGTLQETEEEEEEIRIYLQLPCEMLIGSLSSGKPAPAICSSVK